MLEPPIDDAPSMGSLVNENMHLWFTLEKIKDIAERALRPKAAPKNTKHNKAKGGSYVSHTHANARQ